MFAQSQHNLFIPLWISALSFYVCLFDCLSSVSLSPHGSVPLPATPQPLQRQWHRESLLLQHHSEAMRTTISLC